MSSVSNNTPEPAPDEPSRATRMTIRRAPNLLAFLITDGPKTATESVVDQLFSAAEEGIIDIDACWLTREILTGDLFIDRWVQISSANASWAEPEKTTMPFTELLPDV